MGRGRLWLALRVGLALGLLAASGAGADEASAPGADPALRAGVFDPAREAPAFILQGSDGRPLRLETHRGKLVVLEFGFTSCTDVCPVTLATLARARQALGDDGERVQVVFITVDPERDDAARLREFLRGFDPTFLGGTGSAEALAAVRRDYGIAAEKVVFESGYAYSHSSYTYLIDREGNLRALMPYGQPAEAYAHDLRILLGP